MNLLDLAYPYQKKFITNPKKRKIWVSSRQIGKSWTLAFLLCQKALSKPNGLTLCISTGARAAGEIIRKCQQFAEAIKKLTDGAIDYSSSFDSIKFSNGCRVLSLPSSTDGSNLRGFTAELVAVDEAAFISNLDLILQSIAPSLTRNKNAELIFTTTPAGQNGAFYKLLQESNYNDEWYIQNTTIYDAVNDGLEIDIDSLKSLCPDNEIFEQEYCCKFLSEYSSMIDTNIIDWYDGEINSSITFFGQDVGSKNDRSAIVVCKQIKDITYLDDIIVLNKVSYENQLEIAKSTNEKYKFRAGYIDSTGIGSAYAEFFTKKINSNIKGLNFTSSNKTPMYEYLRSQIFQHKLFINRKFQQMIETDFQNVQRIVSENGQIKYLAGHNTQGHSDITSALVLALNAVRNNPISFTLPIAYSQSSRLGNYIKRI